MADQNTENEILPTIWNVPDDLWEKVQSLLDRFDPPRKTGRKRVDARKALDGMIYRMRTGCQWNRLPKEFGDDASIHRTLRRPLGSGCFPLSGPGRGRLGVAISRWLYGQSTRRA